MNEYVDHETGFRYWWPDEIESSEHVVLGPEWVDVGYVYE